MDNLLMLFPWQFHGKKCHENVLTLNFENPLKKRWKCYGFTMKKY